MYMSRQACMLLLLLLNKLLLLLRACARAWLPA
jgi:hypothetical protein